MQLNDCDLTMNDLSRIEDAFVRVLTSIHHQRIRYQKDVIDDDKEGESDGSSRNDRRKSRGSASDRRPSSTVSSGAPSRLP